MLPSTTRVAVVVPALIDLIRTATSWHVTDGASVGASDVPQDLVLVGLTDGPEAPGYTSSRSQDGGAGGLGRQRWQEDWTVRIFLTSWRGDEDLAARREACADALGKIEDRLAEVGPLEGVWDAVQLGTEADWVPVQSTEGAACGVVFTIVGAGLL